MLFRSSRQMGKMIIGSKDIGLNVGKNGVDLNNGADIWEKGVHESAHAAGENEKWSSLRGEAAKEAWKRENEYNGNRTGISEVNQASWVTQQKSKGQESAINQGTQRAGSVTKFDPYLYIYKAKVVATDGKNDHRE